MTETHKLREMLDERGVEWHRTLRCINGETVFISNGVQWYARERRDLLELRAVNLLTTSDVIEATVGPRITEDTSDGWHSFKDLYHHRAVLFSVVVANNREIAWKSKLHHDGTMYNGMFIVGLDTPWGQASYHYDIDPYWDMFDCEEREYAPEWDGHTPDDAIERIGRLAAMGNERIKRLEKLIRAMYLDLLAEMPESLLENRLIQMRELGIEVDDGGDN